MAKRNQNMMGAQMGAQMGAMPNMYANMYNQAMARGYNPAMMGAYGMQGGYPGFQAMQQAQATSMGAQTNAATASAGGTGGGASMAANAMGSRMATAGGQSTTGMTAPPQINPMAAGGGHQMTAGGGHPMSAGAAHPSFPGGAMPGMHGGVGAMMMGGQMRAPQQAQARSRIGQEYAKSTLFVHGFPYSWTDMELYANFAVFGTILEASVTKDPVTGRSRGFGFIAFQTLDMANRAIASMNGMQVGNNRLSVSIKTARGATQGAGGARRAGAGFSPY
mmetsp:Transcript_12077/g.34016  ORF Transcript_12077/g.34016 Transcript_12077/m.34016 type:complete len:277 (+) Transcript_12077:758-1588(+)